MNERFKEWIKERMNIPDVERSCTRSETDAGSFGVAAWCQLGLMLPIAEHSQTPGQELIKEKIPLYPFSITNRSKSLNSLKSNT